ncbi:hypothetical protein [Brachybacterium sp. EE-P12]|uniref:hypothetical protein n=1 Tax=Brachybacterium sp. EE-P12 TaxID=2306299 RepID=UPI000F8002D1|nr:hypothetical protein [Brachybacterium sp. EE-P12]
MHVTARPRTPLVRLAVAVLAAGLLAAGCTGSPAPEETDGAPSASTPSDAGGASDGGGATAAAVPQEAWEVTPAPEGFTPPEPCTGEGAYYAEIDGEATPELPERGGETLTVTVEGIDGDRAELTAAVGDSPARDIEPITLGETVTLDLWTLSVTSVCAETDQVEFDLID